ncbi:MAG: glycerophosphodiester phosphodiesterase [Gammaproteobacteria bacterium]|nr:glycerophosphodiester phosphodiesterase [Gammaproteobacteria bacterium]
MQLPLRLEQYLQRAADTIFAILPRPAPELSVLTKCRIVSHRGEHNNVDIMENTLAAFEQVSQEDIWGIEFDIRWTKDLYPVVIHDTDCKRVFNSALRISEYSLAEIQSQVPLIPSLQQVIDRYGKKLHLMIEIKQENFPDIELQRSRLNTLLGELTPAIDFHLLSLHPELFELFNIVPNSAMLPVAELNLRQLSQQAIEKCYAGISGQYLLLTNKRIKMHRRQAQKIGVGFVSSRACFYRELNREVDWIFTNHAIKLNRIHKHLIESSRNNQ